MLAEAISGAAVMAMLYGLDSHNPHVPKYGEISEAIATAATQDPLFPQRADGSYWTAAILVALAYKESAFHANVIGDHGKSFGLFQIQPPTAQVKAELLLVPRTASFIAIDLIRQSFYHCQKRGWEEKLSWYVASNGCPTHPIIVKKSMDRMLLATKIMQRHFPEKALPPGT
jgi:hypothetical protein